MDNLSHPGRQDVPQGSNGQSSTGIWGDPANLMRVYPIPAYTPTARVANHIASNATTYLPSISPSEAYPQYTNVFERMDHPQSEEDQQLRQQAELQIRQLLTSSGQSYLPTPSYTSSYSSTPTDGPNNLPKLPMPYTFLPSYLPSGGYREPPTPTSIISSNPSPLHAPETPSPAKEYFENYVDRVLKSQPVPPSESESEPSSSRPPSITSTPHLSRTLARTALTPDESPDALTGPSPSKRRKQGRQVDSQSPSVRLSLGSKGFPIGNPPKPRKSRDETPTPTQARVKSVSISPSQVQVVIPTRKSSLSIQDEEESDEDELDWGETEKDEDWVMRDNDEMYRPQTPEYRATPPMGSGRTGERDTRTNLQRLQTLCEDIFEEADNFPAEISTEDVGGSQFFSAISKEGDAALLSAASMDKLIRYVSRVQGTRRKFKHSDELLQLEVEVIKRLFRLLERRLREVEDIVIFPDDVSANMKAKGKGGKAKRGKKSSKSPEKDVNDTMPDSQQSTNRASPTSDEMMTSERLDKLGHDLKLIEAGGLAAQCCLLILDSEGLPKPLYSEDMISASIRVVKDQITKVILPLVHGLAGGKSSSRALSHVVDEELQLAKKSKNKTISPFFQNPVLLVIAQSASTTLRHLSSMMSRPDLSFPDTLVIQNVYLSIEPLFAADPVNVTKKKGRESGKDVGVSIMKTLRTEALGCLRGAFAKYEGQRQWIIEEILGSLAKVPEQNASQARFQLSDGSSISTTSALLLQLIQASTFVVISQIRRLRTTVVDMNSSSSSLVPTDTSDEELRLLTDAMDASVKSARVVASYLVQRSSTAKATKTSRDTDYKVVLETFVKDLLEVLYRPEWPAASLYISLISRLMRIADVLTSVVEEQKGGNETSTARSIALDHLGDIAARLREMHLKMKAGHNVPSTDDLISNPSADGCTSLLKAQHLIASFLSTAAGEDAMFSGARDMSSIIWAQELHAAISKGTSVVEKVAKEKGEEAEETREQLQVIIQALRSALLNVWNSDENVFGTSDPQIGEHAVSAAVAIARGRSLQNAFEPILHAIISAMDSPAVAHRQKALRGISSVVTVDPDILGLVHVRHAIEDRLSDGSPAVRDAAVELVGKYIVQQPQLAVEYYPQIALRVNDSGLGVRKRVIKLLRGIFSSVEDRVVRVDICCKLVGAMADTDDTVQDMALKGLMEILYPQGGNVHSALLLVEIIGEFQGSDTLLKKALQGIIKECEKTSRTASIQETVEVLIRQLVDATEQADFDALSHIRAIHLLCASLPALIDTNQATVLLSYLRPPANTDEQATNDELLRIFQKCIPHMPRTASTFATDLVKALLPMISKPAGGFQALKETIGCFCVVTTCLTRDYTRLIAVLRACENKIRAFHKALKDGQTPNVQAAAMMLYITALIAEHCNLDQVAVTNESVKTELVKITDGLLYEYLFYLYLQFTHLPIPQTAPSICLGCLFHTYPALVLRDEALDWMNQVFSSPDMDNRARLLGVIHDFLSSEVEKKTAGQGNKDLTALIGSATDLSESGVSTAVLQRNIEHILSGAKSQHPPTQNSALDVLAFTVNQGLYHPLQCLPILISLETSIEPNVADRALDLHATLHQKHSTLVNVRYLDFAKESYDYQRSMSSEVCGHRNGVALLAPWFGLPDVGFILYISENLATLEYKLQEEIITIIQSLSNIISTSHNLSELLESGQLDPSSSPIEEISNKEWVSEVGERNPAGVIIDCSIVVSLAIMTKNHLLDLYSLAEDKCLKHTLGKKTALGDKPAIKKGPTGLDLSVDPLVRGVGTVEEFEMQRQTFMRLVRDEGLEDL
ncbi:hypothetical protein TREMEDRAFT_59198 [Tremella mesenterica DSM 1558]|uniref:uncharacterized protein n=1 Tax=Tremella mesenterica (strain ATCC 24925 / CBS 8224 / DSM 1558 / NBRC 9311 / NRRL Y-6157 / RJB 2259-6 / UBC 559-6) TaxID=578456 RepID=UPI0003F491BD|nr:uncharacterized protein TREMEDRAFT_59198 [Tremella mesenterica DSM 1558]EIW73035.1 hypothetical protein TREMEDRAFT_59198 [Tremella mesenterica DSM 1558]